MDPKSVLVVYKCLTDNKFVIETTGCVMPWTHTHISLLL